MSSSQKNGFAARVRREPLVLFLLIGGALVAAWGLLGPSGIETIQIDQEILRALEKRQADLLGRELTAEEREEVRESYVEEEVLLREAVRRGLQWSDPRVRQRLTRIVRGAMTENVPDPSLAQLEAYYRDNIERYTAPASMTFEQVVYPWGKNELTEIELVNVKTALGRGADATSFGASTPVLPRLMKRQSRADLVRRLGVDFTNTIEPLRPAVWHGPIESIAGIHFVRVLERHPSQVAAFEDLESYLRQDWLMEQMRALQQSRIDEIRARYRIEIVED